MDFAKRAHPVGKPNLNDSGRKKGFLDLSSAEMEAYRQYPVFSAFR